MTAEKINIILIDKSGEIEQLLIEKLLKQNADFFEKKNKKLQIIRARDGAEASLKATNQTFDLAIIDAESPRISETIKIKKSSHEMCDCITLTNKNSDDLPVYLRNSKILPKPFDESILIACILEFLNKANAGSKEKKYSVDTRVVNAIIQAAIKVLSQFNISDIQMEKLFSVDSSNPLPGVISSSIDIKSEKFNGIMAISFDKKCYLAAVSAMLMEEYNEITDEIKDAVGEIINIIYGNAKSDITQYGVQMSIPKIITEAEQKVNCPPLTAALQIPFKSSKGCFYVQVYALPIE